MLGLDPPKTNLGHDVSEAVPELSPPPPVLFPPPVVFDASVDHSAVWRGCINDALRAWMGYSESCTETGQTQEDVLSLIMGNPGQRNSLREYCRVQLRRHWGNVFEFTDWCPSPAPRKLKVGNVSESGEIKKYTRGNL